MTKEEAIWWVNHLFEIRKEEYFNKGTMEDAKEVEEAQCMAIEALKFAKHFDLLKEYQSLQEVVQCKDCDRGFGSPICPIQSQGWAINTDTFYCAWGERREP